MSEPRGAADRGGRSTIPRIIHQIWLGATEPEPPARLAAAAESWRAAHPGWQYRRWSAAEIEALFEQVRPDLLPLYRSYPYWIQRADAARYLVLFAHGGVYADHDVVCVRSMEPLLAEPIVLAPTRPAGFSNDLMMGPPGHPLFRAALDELPESFATWHRPWTPRHLRVMSGTGSLHLTKVVRRLEADLPRRLLSAAEYGHGDPGAAFVRHIPGNTWVGWDTRVLLFFARSWRPLLTAAVVVAGVLAFVMARTLSWTPILAAMRSADPLWLLAAVALDGTLLLFATGQWLALLPDDAEVAVGRLFGIVALTSSLSNVGPVLTGQAAGVHLLATRGPIGHARAVSLTVLEQISEGIAKLILLATTLILLPQQLGLLRGGLVLLVIPPLAVALALAQRRHEAARRLAARAPRALAPLAHFLTDSLGHLGALQRVDRFGAAILFGVLKKVCEGLAVAAVATALGVSLPLWAVVATVAAVNVSQVLPVTPANLGTYEAGAFLVFRAAGVPADTAVALALLQHAAYLLPLSLTGWLLEGARLVRRPRGLGADADGTAPRSAA